MINIRKTIRIPNGLKKKASLKFPLNKQITDLVVPQDGHGNPVSCLMKQACN